MVVSSPDLPPHLAAFVPASPSLLAERGSRSPSSLGSISRFVVSDQPVRFSPTVPPILPSPLRSPPSFRSVFPPSLADCFCITPSKSPICATALWYESTDAVETPLFCGRGLCPDLSSSFLPFLTPAPPPMFVPLSLLHNRCPLAVTPVQKIPGLVNCFLPSPPIVTPPTILCFPRQTPLLSLVCVVREVALQVQA